MTKPIRIQRKRTKGWRMPPNTVSVTRPGPYGNPFRVGTIPCHGHTDGEACDCQEYFGCATTEQAVEKFRKWRADIAAEHARRGTKFIESWLAPLRGKNLACFCALDQPCHADVLLELANA